MGRSPCGERGLKFDLDLLIGGGNICRSPCGERGLKLLYARAARHGKASLPVRGAWIEIGTHCADSGGGSGRSPCGERGLKSLDSCLIFDKNRRSPCGERGLKSDGVVIVGGHPACRSPCGERGLKYQVLMCLFAHRQSLPVRGAWIEILPVQDEPITATVAPRAGSVD